AAPSAAATAHVSIVLERSRGSHCGSERISPLVRPAAVVVSAKGAKKHSLLHIKVASLTIKRYSVPKPDNFSITLWSCDWPRSDIAKRTKGDRRIICPGATRSDSTEIVAGTTRRP